MPRGAPSTPPALTNAEEQQCLHAQEFLGRDLQPAKFLREVPHSDTLAVHPGLVHAVPEKKTNRGSFTIRPRARLWLPSPPQILQEELAVVSLTATSATGNKAVLFPPKS